MTARDELARDLLNKDREWNRANGRTYLAEFDFDWDGLADKGRQYWRMQADAVLAAGYRKPRTITTTEELDALRASAAILAANGSVWVNDGDDEEPWASVVEDLHGGPLWVNSDCIELPATVLHEGAQS